MNQIRIAKVLALIVLVVGMMVMTGWYLDIPILKSILPQWISMKFSTALCFFVSGLILFFMAQFHAGKKNYANLFFPVLSFTILLFMTSMLLGVLFNIQLGLKNLFVQDTNALKNTVPGMPSVGTMIAFTMVALLGFCYTLKLKQVVFITWIFGMIIVVAGLCAILGYLLAVPLLCYAVPGFSSPMAFHTAILFTLLGLGFVLLGRRDTL